MKVTIRDVARLAGVAPSTVSRAIDDNPRISDGTKERVFQAMRELNFLPNASARSLANKTTNTIGLLLPNTSEELFMNPFFVEVMRGVSVYAQKQGYYMLYSFSKDQEEEVEFIRSYIFSNRVDGIVLFTVRENDRCISLLKELDFPAVVIGRPEDSGSILWVDNDNFQAMYNVVSCLIDKGFHRIAFIGGPSDLNVTKDRLAGYRQALSGRGLPLDKSLIISGCDFSEEAGYTAMKELLGRENPDAVAAIEDFLAIGALRALREAGISDIALSGFNNTLKGVYMQPSLTSVDIFPEKLGEQAAKLLLDQLQGKDSRLNHCIIETKILERESTAVSKTEHPRLY